MTAELITVGPDDWRIWRTTRLAALADSPRAFGSRWEDWVDAEERRWRDRLSIPGAVDLLALDVDTKTPVGMATGTPPVPGNDSAELISMWVTPSARGLGVAPLLISTIAEWAVGTGARILTLSAVPSNDAARRAYEMSGFVVAADPGDDEEIQMTRAL